MDIFTFHSRKNHVLCTKNLNSAVPVKMQLFMTKIQNITDKFLEFGYIFHFYWHEFSAGLQHRSKMEKSQKTNTSKNRAIRSQEKL